MDIDSLRRDKAAAGSAVTSLRIVAMVLGWVLVTGGGALGQQNPEGGLLQRMSAIPPDQRLLDIAVIEIPAAEIVLSDFGDQRGRDWQRIARFLIMREEVTNMQFAAFVLSTGYVTDSERKGGAMVWRSGGMVFVSGADWQHPQGPESTIDAFQDYPVSQVSHNDAAAFCDWATMRLPRDEEWVYAARGGDDGRPFPWGYGRAVREVGNFGTLFAPDGTDGYFGTSPVGTFPGGATPFGLVDMSGNVREWTASPAPGALGATIVRGGSFLDGLEEQTVTSFAAAPVDRAYDFVGFRCALFPPNVPAR